MFSLLAYRLHSDRHEQAADINAKSATVMNDEGDVCLRRLGDVLYGRHPFFFRFFFFGPEIFDVGNCLNGTQEHNYNADKFISSVCPVNARNISTRTEIISNA